MAVKKIIKERRWQLILAVIAAVLALLGNIFEHKYIGADNLAPDTINTQTNVTYLTTPAAPVVKRFRKISQPPNSFKREDFSHLQKYVEVHLNINSNDIVLINGRSVLPAELSEKANTLKLVKGHSYMIKINDCPEIEVVPAPNMTISTCL